MSMHDAPTTITRTIKHERTGQLWILSVRLVGTCSGIEIDYSLASRPTEHSGVWYNDSLRFAADEVDAMHCVEAWADDLSASFDIVAWTN